MKESIPWNWIPAWVKTFFSDSLTVSAQGQKFRPRARSWTIKIAYSTPTARSLSYSRTICVVGNHKLRSVPQVLNLVRKTISYKTNTNMQLSGLRAFNRGVRSRVISLPRSKIIKYTRFLPTLSLNGLRHSAIQKWSQCQDGNVGILMRSPLNHE